jgi:hypothetical protein
MDRSGERAVWVQRVGDEAARAILRANRATAWTVVFYVGFVMNVVGHFAHVDQLQYVALIPLLVGALALLASAVLRRRAVRLVRTWLGLDLKDNRMASGEIPPLDELAFQSWLRHMRLDDPSQPERDPAYGEALLWWSMARPEPILSHSCMRCALRPKPHQACGHGNCACARSGHCGWLGPRPRRAKIHG